MTRDSGDIYQNTDNERGGHAAYRDLSEGVGLDHLAGIHDDKLEDSEGKVKVDIKYCIGWQYKSTYVQVAKIIKAQAPDAIVTGGDYPASPENQ